MKASNIFTLLLIVFSSFWVKGQNYVTIGSQNSIDSTTSNPVSRNANYIHFQMVYTATELIAAGLPAGAVISAIGFSIPKSPGSLQNFSVYMGNSLQTTATPYIDNLVLVKPDFTYSPAVCSSYLIYDMINLSTPFIWDGVSSIIINTCTGSNSIATPYGSIRYSVKASSINKNASSTINCSATNGAVSNRRPNIKLIYTPPSCSFTLPWSEDFDGMDQPGYPIGLRILPTCWKAEGNIGTPTSAYTTWASMNSSSTIHNDPASSPNYVTCFYTDIYTEKYLITPGFQLQAGYTYTFKFAWCGDGTSGWDGSLMYNTIQSSIGAVQMGSPFVTSTTATSSLYTGVSRDFVAPTTGTYYFMIRTNSVPGNWYLGFDDFCFHQKPLEPTNVIVSGITGNSANISWTSPFPPPVGGYDWEVRQPGTTPGSPGLVITGSTLLTIDTVFGLTPNTSFDLFVRSNYTPSP